MKGPKIFDSGMPNLNPKDLGFEIGKPLTEEEFREVKSKENVKLLHCEESSKSSDISDSKEELRKKMKEKLDKLKTSRTNKEH
jgi:hypothetical protein